MHYVNCIYIDSDTNYFMILIMYKSPKQQVTNSKSGSLFKLCIPMANPHLRGSLTIKLAVFVSFWLFQLLLILIEDIVTSIYKKINLR